MLSTDEAGPGSSELRRRARREATAFLQGLPLSPDPASALRACTDAMAQATTPAEIHALTELAAAGEDTGLITLRNLLRAVGARCQVLGHAQLAERYARTSDLLDIADRALFQLGIDLLATAHTAPTDQSGPVPVLAGSDAGDI
ncbi:hypothetical protein ACGFYY_41230 [Streptomyces sp. NPDC048331]|uniref:hypothetical protein n=1 Tax=Streptomyces sp. NPDC048331 TaxID=3365534 RepID=UPI003723E75A